MGVDVIVNDSTVHTKSADNVHSIFNLWDDDCQTDKSKLEVDPREERALASER